MKKFLGFLALGIVASVLVGSSAEAQLLPRNRVVLLAAPAPQKAVPVSSGTVEEGSKKLGPVACGIVRVELAKAIQKRDGGRFGPAFRKASQMDDDDINSMLAQAEKIAQTKVAGAKFGAIGDGTIINAIIEFFKSPQGQALIAALIQLLLHALGG